MLDREATINRAKFIQNEKNLRIDNKNLIEIIRKQDSIIKSLSLKNIEGLKNISNLNQTISNLSTDIHRLSGLQLKYEEKKKEKPKMYFSTGINYVPSSEKYIPNVGIMFLGSKLGAGITTGLINSDPYIGGKIIISIF